MGFRILYRRRGPSAFSVRCGMEFIFRQRSGLDACHIKSGFAAVLMRFVCMAEIAWFGACVVIVFLAWAGHWRLHDAACLRQGRCGEARPVGCFWQAGDERQVWACKVLFAGRAGVWGLRRALPAPAQGTRPLRIPLAAALSPMPQHAPDGPCSWAVRRVFSSLPGRNATKNPCPLFARQGFIAHSRQLRLPAPPTGLRERS